MEKFLLSQPPITDVWTLRLEKLLLEIARAAEEEAKRYFIGCGFGFDVWLGKLTRPHEDLDIFPMEEDTQWWQNWFKSRGYIISKDPDMQPYPYAFLPTNERQEYFADVYPVKVAESGNISVTCTEPEKIRTWWEGKNWNEVRKINYKDVLVYVENPKTIIAQKMGHVSFHHEPLAAKHLHDVELYQRFF